MTQTPLPYDAGLWAARGLQDGHEVVTKYGANPDIDIGTGFEVLWNGGDWYTGFDATVADVVTVVSSSANDATGGTGARDVTLSGLDAAGIEIEETITLNGTTPVDSTLSYLRMHRARVGSVGSLDFNDGEITVAQKATPAVVFAVLPAENGSTMISAYTIPAGKTAYITSWFAAFSNLDRGTAIVRLNMRKPSESRRVMEQQSLLADGTSVLPRVYNPPKGPIPALTDIWISAESDTNNVGVAGGFDLILVDDDV